MSDNGGRKISFPKGGMFEDVALRVKLILRLMADNRVSIFLKALPIFTLVYLIFPDLVLGPIDDVAIIWIGAFLFVELCPPEVVQEHMNALRNVLPGEWRDADVTVISNHDRLESKKIPEPVTGEGEKENGTIIDVESWDKKEN